MRGVQRIKRFMRLWRSRAYWKRSYSQCGEDVIVDYVFGLRGINNPSYLDIGANHPHRINNTAYFYEKGCRGINVEANPQLLSEFRKYRPKDINLNVGIGSKDGECEFYVMVDSTLSTFSREERDHMLRNGQRQAAVIVIKVTTVSSMLASCSQGRFPDFLSLDAEGVDLDILRSIDFDRCYPKVICVEAAEYSPVGAGARRTELIEFLQSKRYIEYANTNLNAIMVRAEFWNAP